MRLRSLPIGTVFFLPRENTHFAETGRVWGAGFHGGVYIQERIRTGSKGQRSVAWGPAVEVSGEITVEVKVEPSD